MGQILPKASAADMSAGNNTRYVTAALVGTFVPNQTSFTGSYCFGPGLRSLANETSDNGWDNIAIGKDAGLALTTGYANVLIGTGCGQYMTRTDVVNGYSGSLGNSGNTFVGRSVGAAALGALDNSMYGINCGQNLTDGMDNVASGANALRYIEGGSENVAIGHAAIEYVVGDGNFAGGTGHRLTALGDQAARFLVSSANKTGGKSSVYVGANTRSSSNTAVNENVFGYAADGAGNNSVVIGNSDIINTYLKGFVNIGGDATTRLQSVAGELYIESDAGIRFRDTSSAAELFTILNDGRAFFKTDVQHSDLGGTGRFIFTSGGATTLLGTINFADATTRIFHNTGDLYIESDAGFKFRDTSSSAALFTILNDGRAFFKTDVAHADLEGTGRIGFASGGGATTLYGNVNITGNLSFSSMPTANPGAGILWNDAGTIKMGT